MDKSTELYLLNFYPKSARCQAKGPWTQAEQDLLLKPLLPLLWGEVHPALQYKRRRGWRPSVLTYNTKFDQWDSLEHPVLDSRCFKVNNLPLQKDCWKQLMNGTRLCFELDFFGRVEVKIWIQKYGETLQWLRCYKTKCATILLLDINPVGSKRSSRIHSLMNTFSWKYLNILTHLPATAVSLRENIPSIVTRFTEGFIFMHRANCSIWLPMRNLFPALTNLRMLLEIQRCLLLPASPVDKTGFLLSSEWNVFMYFLDQDLSKQREKWIYDWAEILPWLPLSVFLTWQSH